MKKISKNIYLFSTKKFASNTYLIKNKILTLIDPGTPLSFKDLKQELEKLKIKIEDIKIILNTHEHFDHIMSNKYFKNAVVMIHKSKKFKHSTPLEDNSEINLGKIKLKVIYTPGHSKGSVCFYEPKQKILFSGDTVFAHGTPSLITISGSKKEYIQSLNKLLKLKINKILPGHGDISLKPKEDIKEILKKLK